MQSELVSQYHIILEYDEINAEFQLLSMLMQECKKAGFKNKFREHQSYIEARYDSLSDVLIRSGIIEPPAKPVALNGNNN